jgi:hypothetical protein
MQFYIFGASFADNVYGLIDSYNKSPLHMLTNKDGIKVIETVLKMNNIIPSYVTMRTRTKKGGTYRMMLLSFHLIMPSHIISFTGDNSSKYMKTGKTQGGRTKDEVTADKSRGAKNSSLYMTTNITKGGRSKEEVTADKSRGAKNSSLYMTTNLTKGGQSKEEVTSDKSAGGKNSSQYMTTNITKGGRSKEEVAAEKRDGRAAGLGVVKTKADGSKNDWMKLELISHPSGETFTTRASQTKSNHIAALHHRNAFGPLQKKGKLMMFNKYYDDAKAKNNICTFDCKEGGKWKLTLSKDKPIVVSTEFTKEELNATSADRKKHVEQRKVARKMKKN